MSFHELAESGNARELRPYTQRQPDQVSAAAACHIRMPDCVQSTARLRSIAHRCRPSSQATSDLISSVFKLQTEVARLRADVQRLGTARDTPELRQKIAATNDRMKLSAREIGERLKAAATANNSPQTQKILSDFQVRGRQKGHRSCATLHARPDIHSSSWLGLDDFTIVPRLPCRASWPPSSRS